MENITKINKNSIRAVKKDWNIDLNYWYGIEVKVNKNYNYFWNKEIWQSAYLINKNTKQSKYFLNSFNPKNTEEILKWVKKQLENINYKLENGFELVDYETYERYCHIWENEKRNKNNIVYLD